MHWISRCLMLILMAGSVAFSLDAQARRVVFKVSDGITVVGEELGRGANGVVLIHSQGRDRQEWTFFAQRLANSGFHVLSFDLRGHGDTKLSRDLGESDYLDMGKDVATAASYLRKRGAKTVAFVGAQLGANLALRAAVADEAVDNIVLLSARLNVHGVKTGEAMKSYGDRPVLIVASEANGQDLKSAGILEQLAGEQVHVKLHDGKETGVRMINRVPELEGMVLSWLNGSFRLSSTDSDRRDEVTTGDTTEIETTGVKIQDR
jgi:alpha-beta hydrolase superfamily lysophospholipase